MNRKTDGNRAERKTIADLRRSGRTAHQFRANLKTCWGDDVGFLAVSVLQQSKAGTAARIVFNRSDCRFDTVFLSLEIDNTNFLFVSAADAARSAATVMVTSAGAFANFDQALFRLGLCDLAVIRIRDVTCGRR